MSVESQPSYDFWVAVGTLALASVTSVLAFLTWRVLIESKKMRTEPVFALEPGQYLSRIGEELGGEFMRLNLVNHGQAATDIFATCTWRENEKVSGNSREFYIVSLARDGYAELN